MDAGSYVQVVNSEATTLFGELKQKRKNGEWIERHCALWKNYFLCFKDDAGIKPQVAFILEGFQVQSCIEENEQFAFQLSKPGVIAHTFATSDDIMLNSWIQKLVAIGVAGPPVPVVEESPLVFVSNDDSAFESNTSDDAADDRKFSPVENEKETSAKLTMNPEPLHTSLSFDSATALLQANEVDSTCSHTLQRSQEIEDLLHLDEVPPLANPNLHRSKEMEDLVHIDQDQDKTSIDDDDDVDEGLSFLSKHLEDIEKGNSGKDTESFKDDGKSEKEDASSTSNLIAAVSALNAFMKKEAENKTGDDHRSSEISKTSSTGVEDSQNDSFKSSGENPGKRPAEELVDSRKLQSCDIINSTNKEPQVQGKGEGSFLSPGDRIPEDLSNKVHLQPRSTSTPLRQALISALSDSIKMSGYLNVSAGQRNQWQKLWAELSVGELIFSTRAEDESPVLAVPLAGLQVMPAAWETARPLAIKLVQEDGMPAVLLEPDDVEDLGKWVSGLFRAIQHPNNYVPGSSLHARASSLTDLSSIKNEREKPKGMTKSLSVKDVRHVFPTPSPSPTSGSTSNAMSPDFSADSSSRNLTSPVSEDEAFRRLRDSENPLESVHRDSKKTSHQSIKDKLNSKLADVVCWLGRYIEQEQEQKVLSQVSNPFLAKLRLRHKLEAIGQLEAASEKLQENIASLQKKLATKEAQKKNAGKNTHQGLVRSAEDAKRGENESKRIDKEIAAVELQMQREENKLNKIRREIEELSNEVESEYDQFSWSEDDGSQASHSPQTTHRKRQEESIIEEDDELDGKPALPEWTKKARQKAKAWQKLGEDLK